jgi:hypothetical protein
MSENLWDLLARLMDQPLFLECAVNEIGSQSTRRYLPWLTAVRRGLETMNLSRASRDVIAYGLKRLEIPVLRGRKLEAFLAELEEQGFEVDRSRLARLPAAQRTPEQNRIVQVPNIRSAAANNQLNCQGTAVLRARPADSGS